MKQHPLWSVARQTLRLLLCTLALAQIAPKQLSGQSGEWRRVARIINGGISDVDCRSNGVCAMVGVVVGNTMVWISTDAGRTWDTVYRRDIITNTPPGSYHQIEFVGDSTLIVGTVKGMLAISRDLGRSFTPIEVTDTAQTRVLAMTDDGHGVVVFGWHPIYRVFATGDTGRTWNRVALPDSIPFGDTVRALAGGRVELSGAAKLGGDSVLVIAASWPDATQMVTTNNGESWSYTRLDTTAMMWVHFVDSAYGFLYGGAADFRDKGDRKPSIYRTTNAGATWDLTLIGARVRDIATIDGKKLIATGELNKIYTSLDSGLTWSMDSFPTQGPVTPWCSIGDTGSGFVVIAFGDLIRNDMPGAVARERAGHGDVGLSFSDDDVIVTHPTDARAVSIQLYDVGGKLLGVLDAERTGPSRSVASLREAPRGVVVAVVVVDGRRAATRLLGIPR